MRREIIERWGVRPQATGAVYFIQAGDDDGPIKIGYSNDPYGRLLSLQTGHYEKLRLLGVTPGTVALEVALHDRFAHLRLEGEWFTPDAAILDEIAHSGQVIADAIDAIKGIAAIPLNLSERVRLGDKEHAVYGLLTLIIAAKCALDAFGVTTTDAQIELDKCYALIDDLDVQVTA